MNIFSILDISTAILIIISLNLVTKYRWAWLLYSFSNVVFLIVVLHTSCYGLAVMGFVLAVTGILNYFMKKGV